MRPPRRRACRGSSRGTWATRNAGLGQWLMSRVDEELELRLKPVWISAWDYGQRMEPVKPA